MANAARKQAAQQNVSKKVAPAAAAPVAPGEGTPTSAELTTKTKVRGKSIRSTINAMIAEGKSTEQISEVIVREFPDSRAAALPNKHISFYRSRMRKADPSSVPASTPAEKQATTVTISAKKGAAK